MPIPKSGQVKSVNGTMSGGYTMSRFASTPFRPVTLTWDRVHEIRRLRSDGVSRKEVARRFGISEGHVTAITTRKIWK